MGFSNYLTMLNDIYKVSKKNLFPLAYMSILIHCLRCNSMWTLAAIGSDIKSFLFYYTRHVLLGGLPLISCKDHNHVEYVSVEAGT